MNFQTHFKEGRAGRNIGLSTGISALTRAIGGIQKKRIYGIAASPKVGKSTFCDYSFILSPYEEALINQTLEDVEWIYFCLETDRVDKEFKFAAHYFAKDYNIFNFKYPLTGELVPMCSEYLSGKKFDKNDNYIKVSDEHFELLKIIYANRIIPLFGEYDEKGNKISQGKITIITERDNPTGIRNFLLAYAERNGKFHHEQYVTHDDNGKRLIKQRIVGYTPNNPNKTIIIITDTLRKLKLERNYQMKQNVDKMLEYQVELRDWCKFTFVDIIHLNRNIASVERMKFLGEYIYPTGDDLKDKKIFLSSMLGYIINYLYFYKMPIKLLLDENYIMELYLSGLSDRKIGNLLGCCTRTITNWRVRNNLIANHIPTIEKFNSWSQDQFMDLYNDGMTDKKIATKLNTSETAINDYRKNKLNLQSNQSHNIEITKIMEEILVGTILGDSYIDCRKQHTNILERSKTALLIFAHCLDQKEFCFYKYNILKTLFNNEPKLNVQIRNNRENISYYAITKSTTSLVKYHRLFYNDQYKKIIPDNLNDIFTERSLATLFMDDGGDEQYFYLCSFDDESLFNFQDLLESKWGLKSSIHKRNVVYIPSKSKSDFHNIIRPFIIPSMEYKLKSL